MLRHVCGQAWCSGHRPLLSLHGSAAIAVAVRSTLRRCALQDEYGHQDGSLSLMEFIRRIHAAVNKDVDMTSQSFKFVQMLAGGRQMFAVWRASLRGCRVLSGMAKLPGGGAMLLDGPGGRFHGTQFLGAVMSMLSGEVSLSPLLCSLFMYSSICQLHRLKICVLGRSTYL